jgi:TadE-like protein
MVEFAMLLPLLALLLVGVIEMGFAFKEKLLVDNGVQIAARTGSALGQAEDVDTRVLQALEQGFSGLANNGAGQVLQAQIYRVAPDGSIDGSAINTYTYQYTSNPSDCNWSSCPTTDGDYGAWPPTTRDTRLDGGLESIGVKIFYGHEWILGTQLIVSDVACTNSSNCWTESAVMRLEPTE